MHYYQFNIGDYKSHTGHLTPIEDIVYRRLLDAYYLNERPLNTGITSVARQINMRDNEQEVKSILEEFFTLTDEGWVNKRADQEITKYQSKIEQASKAGKASAERRFNGRSTDVQPTNNHKPITINHKPIKDTGTAVPLVKFQKPALAELQSYIAEKRYTFHADAFMAYYESNGWKVGRNPMKDWRACCVTWQKRQIQDQSTETKRPRKELPNE